MNKVSLTGRLTRDPDVRYSQGEKPVAIGRFTLAVNRRFRKEGEQQADYISCICFGKTAETVEKYFKKGMKMDMTGRIQTGSYTNKDGQTVYTTDVFVEEMEFGESKKSSGGGSTSQSGSAVSPDDPGFMNIPDGIDEEFPFD